MATSRTQTGASPSSQMSPPRNQDNHTLTGFLDLSAELRNEIYRMALCKNKSISIVRPYDLDKLKPKPKVELAWPRIPKRLRNLPEKVCDRKQVRSASLCTDLQLISSFPHSLSHNLATGPPAILVASKQIRFEASQIYYLENTFCFVDSTLEKDAIFRFFDQMARLVVKLKHIEVFRTNRIGHLKEPAEVAFTARADEPCGFVVLHYQPYVEKVLMAGFAVKVEPYVEPCRCRVHALARGTGSPRKKRRSGHDLCTFLINYAELLHTEATEEFIEICEKCRTIFRD